MRIIDDEITKMRKNLGREKKSLDVLYNLLKNEEIEGVSAEFIVEKIMKLKGVKKENILAIAKAHIGDDPRFKFEDGMFKLKDPIRSVELFNAPSYCVVDIETTGISAKTNEIIEIAALRVVNERITDTFVTLIRPSIPISEEITKVTGITNEMLQNALTIEEVIPKFLDFLSDSVFVAHNAQFDVSFINEVLMRYYCKKMINPIICTLKLTKLFYPNLESYSLESVAKVLKVHLNQHHRALPDATACAHILIKLLKLIKSKTNKVNS